MRLDPSGLPLRLAIPLVVLLGSLVITVLSVSFTDWTQRQALVRTTERHALEDAARLVRIIEGELDHDPYAVEQEVAAHELEDRGEGGHSDYETEVTAVIDANGRVLFAHAPGWVGRQIGEVRPEWDGALFQQVRRAGSTDVRWDVDKQRMAVLRAYDPPPKSLPVDAGRRGVVFLEYDLRETLRVARLTNLQHRLIDLPVLFLLAGLLAFWLSRAFARPLAQLASVARRIGSGDLGVSVDSRGPGEVAVLAKAIQDMARQLSEERDSVERHAAHLRKLSQAVEQSPVSIIITDLDARIEYVNEAFVRVTGYAREEVIGQNPRLLNSGKTPRASYAAMWGALGRGESWEGEFINRRRDGGEFVEWAIVAPIHAADGRTTHFLAVKQDITETKRAEAEIHRLAYVDSLTQLPNRALLLDRLTLALAVSLRQDRYDALILLNIDRFKTVNDALGHDLGDALLVKLSERLSGGLRDGDTLARLSGDEFGILLADLGRRRDAANAHALGVAAKVHAGLRAPFVIGGEQLVVGASLGIALFPEYAEDTPSDILRRADTALHKAKGTGGNQVACFELVMGEDVQRRYKVERELRQAAEGGELRLYLQSQVNAKGEIVGAEALVRWQHPERGLLPPAVFIPVAEETELIVDVDTWVLAEVCRILAAEDLAGPPPRLAVNVSPRHFKHAGFCAWLRDLLAATGADPTRLTLEMTEGLLIDNIHEVVAKMTELSTLGIHFSIDDFGTGYSSLAYLKRLPIHELKIDKSFVQDAVTDPNDAALVETILAVARHMHLQVVAEGVETAEQADFLNARATIIHQGYFYGRPEPAEEWLAHWRQGARR